MHIIIVMQLILPFKSYIKDTSNDIIYTYGVMVIVEVNGHGDTSSNPGRG